MKKLFLFGILAILSGCKKDDTPNNNQLIGRWEYRGTSCYCEPPKDPNSIKTGNGNIIVFTASTYKRFKKDTLINSGNYLTRRYDNAHEQIMFDKDTSANSITFFKIDGKILTFYGTVPLAADGPESHYERL
ncbi:hypothetical protein DIU31_002470 [Mucilaginibacter rubeus]|uniref:Lipocalin-like domain-containing protein n=1 Tax=Mucilaginibacter rubeus TaxID=2027860 RepID=A0AAE6JBC2_9SPHI|nr:MULTISPECIES: hypothetical protein [Mucilaginibacter]QEM02440.1 hypothetical protein DIU31_002470 [Mucilaginibacter rubeus]QEM15064.1 hypothetical protein DIU38_002495 [Mucilaginibacter gossypii]QTE42217.1 hypothetical protein J3L19_25300 [Mucilaginibacter rubeus]QTE48819.1 hypothetical protein J3L21_25275 [Mucilaginibacter rubeus]QTE53916.1 hypothetical protein J3L23_16900 [Mucilaginibacter rubeus]